MKRRATSSDTIAIRVMAPDLSMHAATASVDGVRWGVVRKAGFSWAEVQALHVERARTVRASFLTALGGVAGGAIGLLAGPVSAVAGFAAGAALTGRRRRVAIRCELKDGRSATIDVAAGEVGRIRDWQRLSIAEIYLALPKR